MEKKYKGTDNKSKMFVCYTSSSSCNRSSRKRKIEM